MTLSAIRGAMAGRAQQVAVPIALERLRRGGSPSTAVVSAQGPGAERAGALGGVLELGADLAGDDVRGVGRSGDGEEREEGGPALP
jgi:hypothetical protein